VTQIQRQLQEVRESVHGAALAVGRDPAAVRLIAVSKTFPVEDIAAAYAAGQRAFGENKIQELEAKAPVLPPDIEWHMIGHLQSNKSAKALEYASWIHSVNSLKLLQRLDRQAGELGKSPNILIEVNIAGEASKSGASVEEAGEMICSNPAHLRIAGLMTMPPFDADEAEQRRIFGKLRELRDCWAERYGLELPELSMGMSGDFAVAIAEGSTMVRIGTAIFGRRDYV
jgi:hypothetical protein